jgi:TAT (twin-arginine translocation) pathway signal sequence
MMARAHPAKVLPKIPTSEAIPMTADNPRTERSSDATRREFLKAAGAATVAATVGPTILHATDKAGSKAPVLGTGAHQYEVVSHAWGELPSHIVWGETHGVAIDEAGLIYIKHRNYAKHPMDAIAVFDPQGKFVRSFGKEFHRGGHGIDVRKEGNEEFLYLCDVQHGIVAKTTLKGEHVWVKWTPEEPGVYSDKAKYSPTNVAFGPDGGFYIGDGYGSSYIHQYDKNANWVRTWGGFGDAPGKMKTPHGLWLDNRAGREPSLVVADRANARLQYFTLDGKHLGYVHEVSFPAHFDLRGEVMMVPDLHARVSLFDPANKVIAHLGYDPAWTKQVLADGFKMRRTPERWPAGKFIHPHDACFDKDGNIFVVEWVPTGRVSLLRKVG